MGHGRTISPAEAEFWMDTGVFTGFIEEQTNSSNQTLTFNIDMVRLASVRTAISNFVRILTRKAIPVYFHDGSSVNYGGDVIYISAKITNMHEFDRAVGLALHEASHTLLTDFDQIKCAWANIPRHILALSDKKNICRSSLEKFIHGMWNVIEDRYVDTYVFNEAPGYRGYYAALYDDLNNNAIGQYLQGDYFRYPSLKSYDFRIANFTNELTDLSALPQLEDIARTIGISNIGRLNTTKKRIQCAFDVTEMVLKCIDKHEEMGGQDSNKSQKHKKFADPSDYFDFGDDSAKSTESGENNDGDGEVDLGKKMVGEISDIVNGRMSPYKSTENKDAVEKISDSQIDAEIEKEIKTLVEQQKQFLTGNIKKEAVTKQQKALLDLIEKHGITLVRVDVPSALSGNDVSLKIDCVVVQKMTRELVLSGTDMFPLSGGMKIGDSDPTPPDEMLNAVRAGENLGAKLGRRLQIRAEANPVKSIRKKCGKINKRRLHAAGFDADDLFYKIHVEEYPAANLHITVDASSSMTGEKWYKTMTAVTAICKAASMVNNIHITVSFRSTQTSGDTELPYIVMAYDSKVDKFSKIRTLFPYLLPSGCTPEGLAFSAIMNLFEEIAPDEEDRYMLNLSDGEPYFRMIAPETRSIVTYNDDLGTSHTKTQIDKIRQHGVEILSYFIEESWMSPKATSTKTVTTESHLRKNFRKMYGKDSKFIRVDEIGDLAKTLNALFLSKSGK
jgi:hypothetical protein